MFGIYHTSLDFLYLALSVGFGIIVLFLAIALYNAIRIMKDVRTVTEKTKDTIDLVNHYLWQPLKIFMMVMDKAKHFAGMAQERTAAKKKR